MTVMSSSIRIASYNIHGWVDADGESNLDRVAEVVNDHDPDIICLQEVYACWDLPCLLEFLRKAKSVDPLMQFIITDRELSNGRFRHAY